MAEESGSKKKVPVNNAAGAGLSMLTSLMTDPYYLYHQLSEYLVDAAQRNLLFLDVLRQRSNMHIVHAKSDAPTVLHFEYEMILDGAKFVHPCNYHLLKILPPEGVVTDDTKRPFIVFDPRAGHGPGIGGMKHDSEIGNTLRAGHPCYFVGFLPEPLPGQTVEHVCEAWAIFVARVVDLHPKAEKPCLIGNCQAGWQIAMVASIFPELVGVSILAGAPMSYWSGVRGKSPMRYTGGTVGGSWATAFSSDIGNGKFDGAALVANFEHLNPANTYWKKAYNLYSKVDTEASRFLEFEKWWGSPVLLNGEEIRYIVDGLFIGNKFSTAGLRTSEGMRIDIRNIKSPILVFCSHGDDITPPQQALGFVLDLFRSDDEVVASGQTIIYCMHKTIGHLGIFVSSSVATKEHEKFIQNIDLIETLPPGLYEAVFAPKDENTPHADLASGNFILKFVRRSLQDIHDVGCNTEEEDRAFLTAKRYSENLCALYDNYVSQWVRAVSTEQSANLIREMHPIRVRFGMFSDRNPLLNGVAKWAEYVKENRRPAGKDNAFSYIEHLVSESIVAGWDKYRDARDSMTEQFFFGFYGSKLLQSLLGVGRGDGYEKMIGRDLDRERDIQNRIQRLVDRAGQGGLAEALIRGLLYVVRGSDSFDEREFKMLSQLCDASATLPKMSHVQLKSLIRKQHELLLLDEKNALETIPKLLDSADDAAMQEALSAINQAIGADGPFTPEEKRRLQELEKYWVPSHTTPRRRATDVQVFGEIRK